MQGVLVQSLVGELTQIPRASLPRKKKQTNPKTQNRSNVATNSTEILKMVHIKKKKKKRKTKELFTDLSTEKMSYRGEGEHWNLMLQKSSHLQTNKGKPHPVDWHYLKG